MLRGSFEAPAPTLDPPILAEVLGVRRRRARPARRDRNHYLRRVLLVSDVVALICAMVTVEASLGLWRGAHSITRGAAVLCVAMPVWLLVAWAQSHYRLAGRRASHDAGEELATIFWMTTLWSWSVVLLAPLTGDHTPSVSKLAVFSLATLTYMLILRSVSRAWARRRSWYRQNAIMVGAPEEMSAMAPKLLRHPEYGIELVAGIEVPGTASPSAEAYRALAHVPVIRGEVDLPELIAELDVDRVFFGASLDRLPGYQELLSELGQMNVHVDMVPSWCDIVGSQVSLHELEGMAVIAVPQANSGPGARGCKRGLDLVAAGLGLLVLTPLLILCAIAIKLDSPGPVLFRQRRVGRDDEVFEVLKFRSMRADAEAVKHELAELNLHRGGTTRGMFKIAEDPRITRVGRFLRHHSLDELPQLINVLRGDMSLVGPRPLIENEDRQIEGRHRRRSALTPGLTGLWQVNGRSDIPFADMIDLDYLYVTNWSLWGDIKILLRTAAVVTRGRGAY